MCWFFLSLQAPSAAMHMNLHMEVQNINAFHGAKEFGTQLKRQKSYSVPKTTLMKKNTTGVVLSRCYPVGKG